jgi:putative copper export protein
LLILITAAILSFMIFFPVVVATSVFKVLDEKQSSKFLRIFFPKYYLFGLVLSLTGLIIAIFDKNNMSLIVFLLIIIGFLFSRQFLMPIINKAKDNNNEKKFNILHRFSVLINFIQISLCVFLLIIFLK